MHRGGLFGRGFTLAIRWLPSRDQSFTVGVNVPLWGRNIGATRPKRDHVRLTRRAPRRLGPAEFGIDGELALALDEMRERAGWVARLTPEQREEILYDFTVGSTNLDDRSMVMDGEVQVVLGGWQSLYGFLDFILMPGLCEWVETTEQLDALLPPPGGTTRSLAGLMKLSL